jgi:hypothetical protein
MPARPEGQLAPTRTASLGLADRLVDKGTVMADGSFMVDLAALGSAIGQVSGERDAIQAGIGRLKAIFTNVEDHWQSPSGTSFTWPPTSIVSATICCPCSTRRSAGCKPPTTTMTSTEATNTGNFT